MKKPLIVYGMHGLGDNLHQRAIMRQFMQRWDVYLESTWVSVYHDLIAQGLKVFHNSTLLRTQKKNAWREKDLFYKGRLPNYATKIRVSYRPRDVRATGSVLAAMCRATGTDFSEVDFRLPIPDEWKCQRDSLFNVLNIKPTKPILIYRPLVERTEWDCRARNPDHDAYSEIFAAIRNDFFVISLADLEPGKEWIVGPNQSADWYLHRGELPFETMAALFHEAALTFCSPGFACVLSQAVSTPLVCIFGGYESHRSFLGGAKFAPYLGIDPVQPCECFRHDHDCKKTIDIPRAIESVKGFAAYAADLSQAKSWPKADHSV